jgi:hypothetical protein
LKNFDSKTYFLVVEKEVLLFIFHLEREETLNCAQGISKLEDFQHFVIRTARGNIIMAYSLLSLFFLHMAGGILTI